MPCRLTGYGSKGSTKSFGIFWGWCGCELTINVQIFSRQARGEYSARALIERARLCLANPIYRDELRSAGLVFVENHPISDLDFTFQNRAENRSAFDVVFRLVLQEQLLANVPYFESVDLENRL